MRFRMRFFIDNNTHKKLRSGRSSHCVVFSGKKPRMESHSCFKNYLRILKAPMAPQSTLLILKEVQTHRLKKHSQRATAWWPHIQCTKWRLWSLIKSLQSVLSIRSQSIQSQSMTAQSKHQKFFGHLQNCVPFSFHPISRRHNLTVAPFDQHILFFSINLRSFYVEVCFLSDFYFDTNQKRMAATQVNLNGLWFRSTHTWTKRVTSN